MFFMSEDEIDQMLYRFDDETNLIEGARTLYRLKEWTNNNSDGWPYFSKPAQAAKGLMMMLTEADTSQRWGEPTKDVERSVLNATFRPIKAFLTRQGVEYSAVFYTNDHV